MDLLEISERERVSREAAAERLRAIADALARHNDVELERHGMRIKLHVPDELQLEVELEVGDDGGAELEIELSW